MRFLKDKGLISQGWLTLDFGCGHGTDAKLLGIFGYDPHYTPLAVWIFGEKWDVITCNYVLNAVSESEQEQIINQIRGLLAPNGRAYITVRRDAHKLNGLTKRGTIQRNVFLPLPIVYEKPKHFCIYLLQSPDR
jgi:SAM-dependent methyltransferase